MFASTEAAQEVLADYFNEPGVELLLEALDVIIEGVCAMRIQCFSPAGGFRWPGVVRRRRPRGPVRAWAALGDGHHRRPQHAVLDGKAGLEHLHDGAGGHVGALDLHDSLMLVGIERLVDGMDALDAVALEHVEQLALGHGHALEEALEGGVLLGGTGRHGVDCALEVVADVDDIPGEARDGVLGGLLLLALRPPADVLDLGVRTQQLVLEVGGLGAQLGNEIVGVGPRSRASPGPWGRRSLGARRACALARNSSCGVLVMIAVVP